ncbi:MAG: hypothetical protein AAB355_03525 [Patescibacteria group bacterium]
MRYFARRIRQNILSRNSFISLIEIAEKTGSEGVCFFAYYFRCEPGNGGALTKILIYRAHEKEEALNCPPFGTGKMRPQCEWMPIPGRLPWLHNVACAPTSLPHWFPVDSPLVFH